MKGWYNLIEVKLCKAWSSIQFYKIYDTVSKRLSDI